MTTSEFVGDVLRSARLAARLTLDEVAERVALRGGALSANLLGKIERGERTVGPVEAVLLARALGLGPAEILLRLGGLSDEERLSPSVNDVDIARRIQATTFPRRAKSLEAKVVVNPQGDATITRTWTNCGPAANGRPISELTISDRAVSHRPEVPPAMTIVNVPKSLKYDIRAEPIEGGWRHVLRFPDSWTRYAPEEGFTMQLVSQLPGAFRAEGGVAPRKEALWGNRLTWFVDRWDISIHFECGWSPDLTPWAWWDSKRTDGASNVLREVCRQAIFSSEKGGGSLSIEKPLSGYTYALVWRAANHWHDEEGACIVT